MTDLTRSDDIERDLFRKHWRELSRMETSP